MKRFALAAVVLVLVSVSFAAAQRDELTPRPVLEERFLSALSVGQVVHFNIDADQYLLYILDQLKVDEHRKNIQARSFHYEVTKVGPDYVEITQPHRKVRLPIGSFIIVEEPV